MIGKLIKIVMFEKIKTWLKENGFVGFAALIVAGIAMFLSMWMVFAGSIGFFLGKNWEIVRKLWNEKYKEEIENIVDDLKEKIKK